jgi:hypothetical protein
MLTPSVILRRGAIACTWRLSLGTLRQTPLSRTASYFFAIGYVAQMLEAFQVIYMAGYEEKSRSSRSTKRPARHRAGLSWQWLAPAVLFAPSPHYPMIRSAKPGIF